MNQSLEKRNTGTCFDYMYIKEQLYPCLHYDTIMSGPIIAWVMLTFITVMPLILNYNCQLWNRACLMRIALNWHKENGLNPHAHQNIWTCKEIQFFTFQLFWSSQPAGMTSYDLLLRGYIQYRVTIQSTLNVCNEGYCRFTWSEWSFIVNID